ncbi:hypothetical protein BDZ90DRAFT_234757 [Jaminaea rosea]|uniref:Uncharacterized protein n=1 Tax=Jaminaea rosea TaxID=1569628 RepID=A0A316UIW3_9BASI|nr:hypothetical protein BDZ90DRAFT_234757 [Jaminaea rosea]PWN24808.1 hypothetical protein BDZ90DRAFT_234757 [Jaminaea rosea]
MPSPYLPGPFLELSTESLASGGELNVDQLAALWNVFTKVGDSLHKGRRLENFAWRAWHREAHLLPPDASWSDFADSTPLETPALSRAGSISQSFSRKPSILAAQWPSTVNEDENAPSDPEDGDEWSSDSSAEEDDVQQPEAGPSRGRTASPPRSSRPANTSTLVTSPPSGSQADEGSYRRRTTSSSSAFGSRARVRFSNLKKSNRRRPLSFQAALRSLASTDESDDLATLAREHRRQGLPAGQQRRSFQGAPGAIDMASRTDGAEVLEAIAASHSSAPAAAERSEGMPSSSSTKAMPPPSGPIEPKPAASAIKEATRPSPAQPVPRTESSQRADDSKKAKFFLSTSVSRSFEDGAESPIPPPPVAREAPPQPAPAPVAPAAPPPAQAQVHAPPLKPNKSKTDLARGGAHHRSATNLHKSGGGSGAGGKGKHGGGKGSSGRLSALHGLTMTKTQHPAPAAGPSKKAGKATGKPVKFALGGDDDDEFTDEEEEPPKPAAAPAPTSKATQLSPGPAEEEVVEEDDEEGWSSDTSAEAEEERRKVQEAAERRRRNEQERQQEMFKKIPLRSKSAADVRMLGEHGRSSSDVGPRSGTTTPRYDEEPQPQQVPVRGLLSSLFHPEQEPHSPPGQLHGRPHASAADLRHAHQAQHGQQHQHKAHAAQHSSHHHHQAPRTREGSKSGDQAKRQSQYQHHRPPSLILGTPSNDNGGPLRPSKSAAALPVLNVAATTPTAATAASTGSQEESSDVFESGSLIQQRGLEGGERSGRQDGGPPSSSSSRAKSKSKSRERMRDESSATVDAPAVAPHRAAPMAAPIAPQTPRTTRRNMLRDELSESLRQNLLWERQSRNRMLGIGATAAREQSAPAPQPQQQQREGTSRPHRRETVLGGNTLRPLTQTQGAGAGPSQQQQHQQNQHSRQNSNASGRSESSHRQNHHSRSTSSLPRMSAEAAARQSNAHAAAATGTQQLSSAETSDEEDEHRHRGEDAHHGLGHSHSHTSSSGGTTVGGSAGTSSGSGAHHRDRDRDRDGPKKKVMWPGGFPNYHQHGW